MLLCFIIVFYLTMNWNPEFSKHTVKLICHVWYDALLVILIFILGLYRFTLWTCTNLRYKCKIKETDAMEILHQKKLNACTKWGNKKNPKRLSFLIQENLVLKWWTGTKNKVIYLKVDNNVLIKISESDDICKIISILTINNQI